MTTISRREAIVDIDELLWLWKSQFLKKEPRDRDGFRKEQGTGEPVPAECDEVDSPVNRLIS